MKTGQAIRNDDYATITYTSGTTADPAGGADAPQLHGQRRTVAVAHRHSVALPTLIILPLDHCFAHVGDFYIGLPRGASVATVQIGATPMETLKTFRRTCARCSRTSTAGARAGQEFPQGNRELHPGQRQIHRAALPPRACTAYAYNGDGYSRGRGWRIVLKPFVALFDAVLFRKVREAFGGSMKFFRRRRGAARFRVATFTTPSAS